MTIDPTGLHRIPLFPLEVVLFPGAPLPLHIFEPRYKEMIQLCMERHEGFGVVLQRGEELAAVGCTAEILKVVQRYPDGRMDIVTVGRRRFQLQELLDEKAYLEARIAFQEDEAAEPIPAQDALTLSKVFSECYRALHGRAPEPLDERESLAYQIAMALPVALEVRQGLLELRVESARQEHLLAVLAEWLPQLQRISRVKARAGGNGHG